jgi:hypothetical protein
MVCHAVWKDWSWLALSLDVYSNQIRHYDILPTYDSHHNRPSTADSCIAYGLLPSPRGRINSGLRAQNAEYKY